MVVYDLIYLPPILDFRDAKSTKLLLLDLSRLKKKKVIDFVNNVGSSKHN